MRREARARIGEKNVLCAWLRGECARFKNKRGTTTHARARSARCARAHARTHAHSTRTRTARARADSRQRADARTTRAQKSHSLAAALERIILLGDLPARPLAHHGQAATDPDVLTRWLRCPDECRRSLGYRGAKPQRNVRIVRFCADITDERTYRDGLAQKCARSAPAAVPRRHRSSHGEPACRFTEKRDQRHRISA